MEKYIAQCVEISGKQICGPLNIGGKTRDLTLADIINQILKFLYPLAGILLFLFLVWGGYGYLTSSGDPEKAKSAQGKITAAVVGFVLLIMSYLLARLIALIFGLEGAL